MNEVARKFKRQELNNDERVREEMIEMNAATTILQGQVAKLDEEGMASRKREGFQRMRDLQLNRRVKESEDFQLNERLSEVEELIHDNNVHPSLGCMGVTTCSRNREENNSNQQKTANAEPNKPQDSNHTSTKSTLPRRRKTCFIM